MVHVIKVYYDSGNGIPEIRRLAICSDVLTKFMFLEEKIVELYPLLKNKSFRIAWKDSDEDLIQMSSDPELAQALANAEDGLIKLYITLQSGEIPSTPKAANVKTNEEIHPLVVCDGCNNDVKGYRYKCLECRDFDLCSSCHAADKHPEHDMLKLTRPHSIPREWVFPGARNMWRAMFGRCPKRFHAFHNMRENSAKKNDERQKPADVNCDNKPETHQNQSDFFDVFATLMNENATSAFTKLAEMFPLEQFLNMGDVDVNVKCAFKKPDSDEQVANKDAGKDVKEDNKSADKSKVENIDAEVESNSFESKEIKLESKSEEEGSKMPQSDVRVESKLETEVNKLESVHENTASAEYNSSPGARPKVISLGFSTNDTAQEDGNEQLSSSTFKPPVGGLFAPESVNCDDWTLLNKDDADKNVKPSSESADDNCVKEQKKELKHDEGFDVLPQDPKIANALMKMKAMGFTNEGGWLERLLVAKEGNINDALDALYPNTQRH